MQRQRTSTYGEPEERAWGMVLAAIEEAMDVDGLQLFDRGQLAEIHDKAAWHVGSSKLVIPLEWLTYSPQGAMARWTTAHGPGGIIELCEFGMDNPSFRVLRDAGHCLVSNVVALGDEELLRVQGIGPVRWRSILLAIEAHAVAQPATD